MIIDTHVHYTEPSSAARPYAIPPGSVEPVSVDELVDTAKSLGIDRVVQVTASCMGHDNAYAFEGAQARPDGVFGVVGRFDPFAPDLPRRLAAFMAQPRVIGVRHTLHHAWTAAWLAHRALDPFFAEAQRLDVPVFLYAPDQVDDLIATARRFPDLRLVVDHTALQHTGASLDDVYAQWDRVIALGKLPNVWLKVSYFPEAAARFERFPFPGSQARFKALHEAVGARRMVWGSNFPPLRHLSTWGDALAFVRDHCPFLGEDDRAAILGRNFERDFAPRIVG
jgi:predicted TIM-barrel fold metal-dependent hydrolase